MGGAQIHCRKRRQPWVHLGDIAKFAAPESWRL
jgi:hypothetical protein